MKWKGKYKFNSNHIPIGTKFGKLTVIEWLEKKPKQMRRYLCKCECGNTKIVYGNNLMSGNTTSCGCTQKEVVGNLFRKHGFSTSSIYRVYVNMLYGCYNKSHLFYKDYGAKGIKVCSSWRKDFNNFYDWAIKHGYSEELSLNRKDDTKNFTPSNCTFIKKISDYKQSKLIHITYKDETHSIQEWSSIVGISYTTILRRLQAGVCLEKTLFQRYVRNYKSIDKSLNT